jgi:hypothetical protein
MSQLAQSLHDRCFRSKHLQITHPVTQKERPPVYKEYQDDRLVRAYEAVRDGHLSIRRAAEEFSVPKSTLADRVSGRVRIACHSGPDRYLSDQHLHSELQKSCLIHVSLQAIL